MNEAPLVRSQQLRDAQDFADSAVAMWCDVCVALSPIIGLGGVSALYSRTISLNLAAFPWLMEAGKGSVPDVFTSLGEQFSQQSKSVAGAAHDALLHSFVHILSTLVGASLTNRLLQAVWDKHGVAVEEGVPI